ncbi:MAG: ChbG/HpnK family deacetylase [Lachnospiraceae bacterium]|nr:ChbG/HpnK family deacetylase [Lachnospiraceae bacterium]
MIIYHADDYAANQEISEHILECHRDGVLNSVSVLFNSPHVAACMEMLKPYISDLHTNIHLNLAEGPSVADPKKVPLLVDERGMLRTSFFRLFLISLLPRRSAKRCEWKKQISFELRAQLEIAKQYVSSIRIDSHQHYHMIPMVLEAIFENVEPEKVEYIRITSEPFTPYLKHPDVFFSLKPINLVKGAVLKICRLLAHDLLTPLSKKTAIFCGILMSGHMDHKRVSIICPELVKIAKKKGLPVEILAHPGGVAKPDDLLDPKNADCVEFYLSNGRNIDHEMFCTIKKTKQ